VSDFHPTSRRLIRLRDSSVVMRFLLLPVSLCARFSPPVIADACTLCHVLSLLDLSLSLSFSHSPRSHVDAEAEGASFAPPERRRRRI
jgi:hypothetical protein